MPRTRVLLVDDDARFAASVRASLAKSYDVVGTVGSGAEVPAAVAELAPDVVVIDLVMRGGDGLEAADRLRRAGQDVPVVVFSSLFDQRIAREAMASGYGYVEKAGGVEALELAIEGAVDLGEVIDLRDGVSPPEPE